MDGLVFGIVGFLAALVAFDLVALRFGHDSRVTTPQPPLGASAPGGVPAFPTRRPMPFGRFLSRSVQALRAPVIGRRRRPARKFVPLVCREPACALRPDLAAHGK